MKPWKFPKIEGSILNYKVPPLWPIYAGEKRTTFAKALKGSMGTCFVTFLWGVFTKLN